MLSLKCPNCGAHLEFPDAEGQDEMLCTVCSHSFHAPRAIRKVSRSLVGDGIYWVSRTWKKMCSSKAPG